MLCFLTPIEYDIKGSLQMRAVVESSPSRRVNKRKTLNGSVAIYDGGSVLADEDLRLTVDPWTDAMLERLRELQQQETLRFAWYYGVYRVRLQDFTVQNNQLQVRLMTESVEGE